ncbi:GNAT family N-acetyltransferase [Streptomyces sp. CB00455]|uniref:GNAT family N-acetyltransferase n=1 Tax=Streptomyces sp. CB00455 TaxID=1703927 RepID=UPI00093D0E76|nr:GNAT family N-acetyltransferase [Streptomyces sp. CB00455]
MAELRAARVDQAEALTGLVRRSKAYWGYGPDFLDACAPELRIRPDEVTARRIVVAQDAGGRVLGLASLEGSAPRAALGLLFVEPRAIGRGVGRLLYRDALRRAVDLGVRRLVIDADPHAAGFYRAMGAVAAPGGPEGLVRFEVAPVPLAAWARAWTGGRRGVHVGNVAEFNAQFADASLGRDQRAAHHYACLAAFYSPYPAALVLPRTVSRHWTGLVCRQLGWAGVEVFDGLAEAGPGLSEAVRERPALAALLTAAGLPLVPWGRTRQFALLSGRPWREGELRYESKSAAHGLFARILSDGGHPGIVLPAQWRPRTRWGAARLVAARAGAGESTVLKSEHGVGGSGTTVLTPGSIRAAGGARAALRHLPRGPLLVEEFVGGPDGADGPDGPGRAEGPAEPDTPPGPGVSSGPDAPSGPAWGDCPRDLTYDGFVDADGGLHSVGAAVMDVEDGGYRGATVGPGVVPGWARGPLLAFGEAVGRELAADGYRGWFDVDFVTDGAGRLAPTETNLRLTGPSVAFLVAARLDVLRGAGHLVRIADRVELGARLPEAQLDELCEGLARECAEMGAVFVPAIPTAAFDPAPWIAVLVAAHGREVLDAAEALIRARVLAVGDGFEIAFASGSGSGSGSGYGSGYGPTANGFAAGPGGAARAGQSPKSKWWVRRRAT